ncbi:MAG TPA: cytochrome c [Verrucomicrobiae bacterium]|nr:cytochrome c [Verrucomicrobiae bacterium]
MKTFASNLISGLLLLCLLTACRRDMFDQPKSNPLRASDAFPDGVAARPSPPHTIAQGHLDDNTGTNLVAPAPLTRELLERGHQRYDINCAPCHGLTGDGDGVVVQRGFPRPPSYHIGRLQAAPVDYFFGVMTRGYGVMFSQAAQVTPEDRWAIAAYIRTLQLSQHAGLADVPDQELAKLRSSP